MIDPIAIIATAAVAAFAVGAFIALEQDCKETLNEDEKQWVKSERLYRRTMAIIQQDRAEARK
jgi:hypothetical protein